MMGFRGLVVALELATLVSTVSAAEPTRLLPDANEKAAPAQTDPRRVTVNKPVIQDRPMQSVDQTIAACLVIDKQGEVKMAELALSHAKQDRVRDFAKMMEKDHSAMLAKLERFQSQSASGAAVGTARNANGLGDDQATTRPRAGGTNSEVVAPPQGRPQPARGGFDFLSVKRQIGEQCLASAREAWEKKGGECEMGYVGQQIVAHQHMIDSGKVLRQYASPELQQLIDEGVKTAEEHKAHAEELIAELAKDEYGKK